MTAFPSPPASVIDEQRSTIPTRLVVARRACRRSLLPLATAVGGAALGLAADLCVRPLTRGKLMRAFDNCAPLDDVRPDQGSGE